MIPVVVATGSGGVCNLLVLVDHSLYLALNKDTEAIRSKVALIVEAADKIYKYVYVERK